MLSYSYLQGHNQANITPFVSSEELPADSAAKRKNKTLGGGRIALAGLWADPMAGRAKNTEAEGSSSPLNTSGA